MCRTLVFSLGLFAFLPLVIAHFECSTSSDSIVVHDAIAELAQYGSASELKPGLKEPWPLVTRNSQQLRVIKYCYGDDTARNAVHCDRVMHAFTRWADLLGSPASAATMHGLAWEEAHDGNPNPAQRKHEYCYDTNYQWNSKVDPGTLVITLNTNSRLGQATVGYDVLGNNPDRNQMRLGAEVDIDDIVHEIGHVFGMNHEMIRHDRDEYLYYQCKNVVGYPDALERAMRAEKLSMEDAHEKLCEDQTFAQQYQFAGAEFTKNPYGIVHDDGDFDLQSIMLYRSEAYETSKCLFDMYGCPLLQYIKINDKTAGMERIPPHTTPSARDIEWVKKWYPWIA